MDISNRIKIKKKIDKPSKVMTLEESNVSVS